MSKPQVLIIAGPTASGKSRVAIEVAKRYNGEIINADSMQIYKGLDIGTAKINYPEQLGVPHHLLDIVYPNEAFSIADYQTFARMKIEEVISRHKIPILVGGSGLYIQSLVYDYNFTNQPTLDFTRYEVLTNQEILTKLQKLDHVSAETIDFQNRRRLIRALALAEQTTQTKSEREATQQHHLLYNIIPVALMPKRNYLYECINKRVEIMMQQGLIAEVDFFQKHYDLNATVSKAIGYREVLAYLKTTDYSKTQLIQDIQQHTRQFAKRQITWFNNQRIDYHPVKTMNIITETMNFFDKQMNQS